MSVLTFFPGQTSKKAFREKSYLEIEYVSHFKRQISIQDVTS